MPINWRTVLPFIVHICRVFLFKLGIVFNSLLIILIYIMFPSFQQCMTVSSTEIVYFLF